MARSVDLRPHDCARNVRSRSSDGPQDERCDDPQDRRSRRTGWRRAARVLLLGAAVAGSAWVPGALTGCGRPTTLSDGDLPPSHSDLPPSEIKRPRRVLPLPMPAKAPVTIPVHIPMPAPIPLPLPVPVPLPARVFESFEPDRTTGEPSTLEGERVNRLQFAGVSGRPLTLTPVQRGRKETPSGSFLTLRLLEPMNSRWRVANTAVDNAANSAGNNAANNTVDTVAAPDDLRVEVRLFPKSLPRWRLVGSSALNATGDSTWIEFTQAKLDQVLKLKVDCRWTNSLEITAVAHFQPAPDGPSAPLSMATRQKADQHLAQLEQQLAQQRQWLAARGAFTDGGFAGQGFGGGGFSASGKSSSSGKGATSKLTEWRKMWEQQSKLAVAVRERLDRLATLQQTLEQEGRLHIRLVRFSTGAEVPLVAIDPPV